MELNFNDDKKIFPKELQEYYSKKKLGDINMDDTDLKYSYDQETELLTLGNEREEVIFKFLKNKTEFPKDVQTTNDLNHYLYNSQKIVEVDSNDVIIRIGNKNVPMNYWKLDKKGRQIDSKLFFKAPEFSKRDFIKWKLKTDNQNISIKLKRVSNEHSAYIKKYLYFNKGLKITLYLSPKDKVDITIGTEFKEKLTTKDIINALDIQLSFFNNSIIINDIDMKKYPFKFNDIDFEDKYLKIKNSYNFWNKVIEVEKYLKLNFKVKFPIDNKTNILLDKLIISFVFNEEFRENIVISNAKFKVASENDIQDAINEFKDDSILGVAWIEEEKVNLFNKKITLTKYFRLTNYNIRNIQTDKSNLTIKFEFDKNEDTIVSSKYILDKDIEFDLNGNVAKEFKYIPQYKDRIISNY